MYDERDQQQSSDRLKTAATRPAKIMDDDFRNLSEAEEARILIVDDHPLTRMGIASMIERQSRMKVVAQAGSAARAVEAFLKVRPDLVLMDLRLPDKSGVEAVREIRRIDAAAKIVVVTTYEGDEDIHQALTAGVSGYVIKGMSHEVLLKAVRRVLAGHRYLPPAVNEVLSSRVSEAALTDRERAVLQLMLAGRNNREMAEDLAVRESTIKTHVSDILTRLGVRDRTQAVVEGLRRGVIHL